MRFSYAFPFLLAGCLLTLCSCSRSDREEIARLQKELDTAKAELAQIKRATKGDPNHPDPELKVAQAVAEEFLGHAIRNAPVSALELGTTEFKKRFANLFLQYVPVPEEKRAKGSPFGVESLSFSGMTIKSGELSSGKDMAMFKGELHSPKGLNPILDPYPTPVSFTLRVVNEKTSGKWKVDGFDMQ